MTNLPYGQRSSQHVKDIEKLYKRQFDKNRFSQFLEKNMNKFGEVYIIAPYKFVQCTNLSWTECISLDNNGIQVGFYQLNKEKGVLEKYELFQKHFKPKNDLVVRENLDLQTKPQEDESIETVQNSREISQFEQENRQLAKQERVEKLKLERYADFKEAQKKVTAKSLNLPEELSKKTHLNVNNQQKDKLKQIVHNRRLEYAKKRETRRYSEAKREKANEYEDFQKQNMVKYANQAQKIDKRTKSSLASQLKGMDEEAQKQFLIQAQIELDAIALKKLDQMEKDKKEKKKFESLQKKPQNKW